MYFIDPWGTPSGGPSSNPGKVNIFLKWGRGGGGNCLSDPSIHSLKWNSPL